VQASAVLFPGRNSLISYQDGNQKQRGSALDVPPQRPSSVMLYNSPDLISRISFVSTWRAELLHQRLVDEQHNGTHCRRPRSSFAGINGLVIRSTSISRQRVPFLGQWCSACRDIPLHAAFRGKRTRLLTYNLTKCYDGVVRADENDSVAGYCFRRAHSR
jgi:hypothetical protein